MVANWQSKPVHKSFEEIIDEEDINEKNLTQYYVFDREIDSEFYERQEFSQYKLGDYPIGYQETSFPGFNTTIARDT